MDKEKSSRINAGDIIKYETSLNANQHGVVVSVYKLDKTLDKYREEGELLFKVMYLDYMRQGEKMDDVTISQISEVYRLIERDDKNDSQKNI